MRRLKTRRQCGKLATGCSRRHKRAVVDVHGLEPHARPVERLRCAVRYSSVGVVGGESRVNAIAARRVKAYTPALDSGFPEDGVGPPLEISDHLVVMGTQRGPDRVGSPSVGSAR